MINIKFIKIYRRQIVNNFEIKTPLSIPNNKINTYLQNYSNIIKGTENLFLFTENPKIKFCHKNFYKKVNNLCFIF